MVIMERDHRTFRTDDTDKNRCICIKQFSFKTSPNPPVDKKPLWQSLNQNFFFRAVEEERAHSKWLSYTGVCGSPFPFLLVSQQDLGLAGTIEMTESERLRKLSVR